MDLQPDALGLPSPHPSLTNQLGVDAMDTKTLDRLLELQFMVAWAGEACAQPARQPWWRTNWIHEFGGHDLLARMMPRTADWAQFELAREAACRVDRAGLTKQAKAQSIRSIFNLGPELDARLGERLFELKTGETDPYQMLPALEMTHNDWDEDAFTRFVDANGERRNFVNEPFGKRLQGDAPDDPVELVQTLMQSLTPLDSRPYPRPYVELT